MKRKLSTYVDINGKLCECRRCKPLICGDYTRDLLMLIGKPVWPTEGATFTLHVSTEAPQDKKGWWSVWLVCRHNHPHTYWSWGLSNSKLAGAAVYHHMHRYLTVFFKPVLQQLRRQHKARRFQVWLKLEKQNT